MTTELFGAKAGWPDFNDVSDRVRGGKSSSALVIWISDTQTRARFSGVLDIEALGGAGFASQSHQFPAPLALARGSHLALSFVVPATLVPGQPTSFVLVLKNDVPERRPDGRRESVVSFEYKFDLLTWMSEPGAEKVAHAKEQLVKVDIDWDEFVPTYRGRERPGRSLDPSHITELSIMCRSNFGKQHGDFSLDLLSITSVKQHKASSSWLASLLAFLAGCFSIAGWGDWFGARRARRGALRLADDSDEGDVDDKV